MDPRLQRRVQRYGWDKAVGEYEAGWRAQLEPAQSAMLRLAELQAGERVLEVASGTGLISFRIVSAIGESGTLVGTDISQKMVSAAQERADELGVKNARFCRLDAEELTLDDAPFDAAICGLGLMYVPSPLRALEEMRRHLRPGGRAAVAVWGARAKCGWAEIFPITDARVASDVCPMFFHVGTLDTLERYLAEAGFTDVIAERLDVVLRYASDDEALNAAFRGGPVALAYDRFDDETKQAVHAEYLASIASYWDGKEYAVPGEFVVARGRNPA